MNAGVASVESLYPTLPLFWPIKAGAPYRITQEYGEKKVDYSKFGLIAHNGLDIAAASHTPIITAHPGQVWAYFDPQGYGECIEIWYPHRGKGAILKTIYAHLSIRYPQDYSWVQGGQIIGDMGSTGNSTGVHLHFGVKWLDGKMPGMRDWVDPRPYLPNRGRYK